VTCDLLFPTAVFVEDFGPVPDDETVARYALNRSRYDAGVSKTNVGGYQSEENFFAPRVCQELAARVGQAVESARQALKIAHPLLIDGAWVNVNGPGHYNHRHVHPRSLLSGVYYLQADDGAGGLVLHTPLIAKEMLDPDYAEVTAVTSNAMTYPAKPGRLVLFPAWLEHSVEANRSSRERISVAFNVWYKM
jgi:uncharacterized protein (TIGR02466 family)